MSARKQNKKQRYCVIKNCFETDPMHEFRSFHKFPKNPEKRESWLKALKLESDHQISSHAMVCDRHFLSGDYGCNYLRSSAIPSKDIELEYDPQLEFIECRNPLNLKTLF